MTSKPHKVLIILLLWAILLPQAEAAPAASRILRETRTFGRALKEIHATVREERGAPPPFALIQGARQAISRGLQLSDAEPWEQHSYALSPEWPPGQDIPLHIVREKTLSLGDQSISLKELSKTHHPTELRLLTLAIATAHSPKLARRRLKTRMAYEVLTLDRIDERYVWALGDDKIAIWVDRELYRPVRLEVGPDVLDDSHWTLRMHYNDQGIGRGWFPDRIIIEKDRKVVVTYHVTSVSW